MKLLHVTNSKNINSIIKNGLLPSYIELDSHWDTFKSDLMHRSCIYLWNAETYRNDKYIRDMIYTKMFIHPRNNFFSQREIEIKKNGIDIYDDDAYIDFNKLGGMLIGDSTNYSVLEIDSMDADLYGWWQHVQEPSNEKTSTTTIMDDYYAHDDKEIHISGNSINFNNINIVEEVLVRKYKNNKLGFTFKKK